MGQRFLLGLLIALSGVGMEATMYAQNFGSLIINRKKITLTRKLPPQGHIEGTTFKVDVTATGLQQDLPVDLKSTLESVLIRNDSRLRSQDTGRADTIISCRITSFSQPQPQTTQQAALNTSGKGSALQNQAMVRVSGLLTVSFQAKDDRSGRSIAADNVTAKFDQEYTAAGAQQGVVHTVTHTVSHLTKGGSDDDTPPTRDELHNRLIQDAALQIASHLVNTTEQVEVYLAKGGGLDQADKLIEGKLYTRALEALETMTPFPKPEDDAYRLYDLGVVNEALAYQAEDIQKARKYLQEASIDYGKAIDGKPTEKYFLQPQTRIDTALAHYKILGDQKTPPPASTAAVRTASTSSHSPSAKTSSTSSAASSSPAPSSALTNQSVISMVAAKLDEANIIDTIQHASSVSFDLTPDGQVDLAKNNVSGKIITAMKTRSRTSSTHHVSSASGKSGS
jgi:hypothetical protein